MTRHSSFLIIISSLLAAAFLFSCGSSGDSHAPENYVDTDNGIYHIANQGLTYNLGKDNDWLIAPPENLPEQFGMCVVDTANQISVSLIQLREHQDISALSPEKIGEIVKDITQSNNSGEITVKENTVKPVLDNGETSWRFYIVITLNIGGEDTDVLYQGKLFSGAESLCAIVATAQPETKDLSSYLNRLKR